MAMITKLMIIDATNDFLVIKELLPLKLLELECKHIPYLDDQTTRLHQNSLNVGYDNDILGSHRIYTNIFDDIDRIYNMSQTTCLRAVRIVITQDGKIWSDNTHWTISYLIRYGKNTKLQDIPFYVIDFREDIPIVINYNYTLFDSITEIKKAVNSAQNIQIRLNNGWRNNGLNYTIGELFSALVKIRAENSNNNQ